jgi:septation ring formation regulator EzrA
MAALVLIWKVADTAGLLNPLKNIVNSINKDRIEARQFERDRRRDIEEAVQVQQVQSLGQVLNINETLIGTMVNAIDENSKMLREARSSLVSIQGKLEITTREWSKIDETLSDIDIHYHEIKQMQAKYLAEIELLRHVIDKLTG